MAKTKTEVSAQIRFSLSQLSARNGQMDFEHICRFYARGRIHPNILPATGPVQSGGDQGRDFETFHSYMSQCSIAETSFVGRFSSQPVAFACSLEQDPAKKNGKIETDVATILKSGVPVERIYFFSGQDIPVAKRHKVQERVRESKGIPLEVIDANALAEHLSDPDLFWVATRYLDVPSEFYVMPAGPSWYNELKAEFQQRNDLDRHPTFEEFSAIKSALRRIYKDELLKVDLPFWFDKLSLYLQDGAFRSLKRKAIYEQFFAKLIGQNDASGQEDFIRDYYFDFAEYRTPALLEDATLLLSLVINSKNVTGHHIDFEEMAIWQERLATVLEQEFVSILENNGKRVQLAVICANYQFLIADHGNLAVRVKKLVTYLQEAVPYFNEALFYPFDELSHSLNYFVEILLKMDFDDPVFGELETIARLVDDEVGRRYGEERAGERLKQRAVQYYEKKRYLEALDAFHQLKHKWINASSPERIILTSLLIADCYKRLEMNYASRYYALAGAQLVDKSEDVDLQKYLPKALAIAANASYTTGAWLSYINMLDLCVLSHLTATKDFDLYDEDKENVSIVLHPAVILYIVRRFNLSSQHLFSHRVNQWYFIGEEINRTLEALAVQYDQKTDQELYESLQGQLNDRVFNDFGITRTISFEIYGSRWTITFPNDFDSNAAGEQLAAIIQILMVELENAELYLLRTAIYIDFSISDNIHVPEHHPGSSNTELRWRVSFPANPIDEFPHDSQMFYSTLVVSVLQEISLLPLNELMNLIDEKFTEGNLLGRLLFVTTYQHLYENFVSKSDFLKSARQYFTDGDRFSDLRPRMNKKLLWNDSVAPKYNQKAALQTIQNRMSFLYPYEITLPILKKSSSFQQVVNILRERGWLDWQIAVSVGNLIVNYKIQQTDPIYNPNLDKDTAYNFFRKPEKEWYIPIPESALTVNLIDNQLRNMLIVVFASSFGLSSRAEFPNADAILELLSKRFNLMLDGADIKVFD